jgi:alpha-1,2-mannosyltransferase
MVFSVLSGARLIGLSVGAAWAVQIIFSAAAIVAVVWTYWRRRDPELSAILLATVALLATPWVLTYDLVVLGWVVDRLRRRTDPLLFDDRLLLAVWTLPVTGMLAALVHVPLAPLVLASLAALLLSRLARPESRATGPQTADPSAHLAAGST